MAPKVISHYRVVRRLGTGGMGEVYLAEDTKLGRLVALKVMSAELAKDPNQRKRFRTEAKAASALSHPHVCVIHEVGETGDGRPFLAMEYVEGQTLDVVLKQRRLRIREVVSIGIQAAEALEAAHARGLVHRDVKPGNLMLNASGEVKVMDFGLAKRFAPDELSPESTSAAHTRTGMLIGTPQYVSPEQALARTLDPRTDLFSLGVVLYEMVAGQRPFLGRTVPETVNNIINQRPPALGLDNPIYSPALDNLIFKCLEKDPEKRYPSAGALALDLRKLKEDSERALAASGAHDETSTPLPTSADDDRKTLSLKMGARRHTVLGWAVGIVAVALLALGTWQLFRPGASRRPATDTNLTPVTPRKSVAVLPFVNISADKGNEYLSDGITEEIITTLSKLKGLKVPARTSCFAFKGKNEDIQKIGQQLHVATVLEGSISKAGNKLRVTAQLINLADGFHIWSESYDRGLDDLLAIRTDVAARVAEALKGQLLGAERQQLARRTTENPEAYRFYLQGRYSWNQRTPEDIRRAIEYFYQAIAKDPAYALAYAGLADSYAVLPFYAGLPRPEALPKARAAALKALELDSTLAEPHATLADIKAFLDWDWSGAEVEFRRAIALNPNYATAHFWFANLLAPLGRHAEALAETKQALEIDPLSRILNAYLGFQLFLSGETNLAINVLQKQIALDPSFVVAHEFLGGIYYYQHRFPEALAEFEAMHTLDASGVYRLGNLACVYARLGRTNDAQRILDQMLELQRQGLDYRVSIAWVQQVMGDDERALGSLEKAADERAFGLEALHVDPDWNTLSSHPRFQAILKRMNLVK